MSEQITRDQVVTTCDICGDEVEAAVTGSSFIHLTGDPDSARDHRAMVRGRTVPSEAEVVAVRRYLDVTEYTDSRRRCAHDEPITWDDRTDCARCANQSEAEPDDTDRALAVSPDSAHLADMLAAEIAETIGARLAQAYPRATSGDVRPSVSIALDEAVRSFVAAWVADNVPPQPPLTFAEAVGALVVARDALREVVERDQVYIAARPLLRGTLDYVGDALARSGMSDDDLPRP